MYSFNKNIFPFLWYDIYVLKILNFFLVINYKKIISHLEMFKIHVHGKTMIPLFYSVIEIMHISRIVNNKACYIILSTISWFF